MEEFVDDRNTAPGDDPPVTAVASRRVKQGREQEFEEWLSGILAAANEAPGYLGSEVLRPNDSEDDDEYRIVFRFDHASNLHAWENSDERQRWLRKAEPLLHEEKVHVLTGLETWFTLPSKPGEPSPPRYKMVVVTWLGVFPIVTVIFSLFGHWLNLLPTLVRTLVFTAVNSHLDDLRRHASHNAPVFLLALPRSPREELVGSRSGVLSYDAQRVMANQIISYLGMCGREGTSLQRGMYFGLGGDHSVVLMFVRPNAFYRGRLEDEGTTQIYEDYNELRSDAVPVRRPSISPSVSPTVLPLRTAGFTKPLRTIRTEDAHLSGCECVKTIVSATVA